MNNKIIAAAISCVLSTYAHTAEIKGKVVSENDEKVTNAKIIVRGSDQFTITNGQGEFLLNLPSGSYTLDIEAGNHGHYHESLEVQEGSNPPVEFFINRHQDNKIVIRANPLEHTKLDMATPTILVTGEDLALRQSSTLGDILQSEPGISVSSFGPAVSRPVIRGLSGSRVRITTNQMSVQDASTVSVDHDVSVEPLLAEQIEVIKGPATLVYGSGAIGGVVNVTDSRINPHSDTDINGGAEIRLGDSTTSEQSLVFTLNGGAGDWRWHLDGYDSSTDDLKIPGAPESEILHQTEDGDEELEATGLLENSASEAQGFSIGTTYITDSGHWGFGFNQLNKEYGIPGHGHEEEHDGMHSDDDDDEESVAIDMEQSRFDLQGEINNPFSGFKNLFVGYSYTDYKHKELEGAEIGTMFKNRAWELRSHLQHELWHGWNGVMGIQLNNRDFSAIGDEAFVPPSNSSSIAAFVIEEKHYGNLKWELGGRVESISIDADGFSEKYDNTVYSVSSGWVLTLNNNNKFAVNLSRATRAPEVEELYSFGPHIATRTFEIGNANLSEETSNNIDISYRFNTEQLSGEINLYHNRFNDFIFQAIVDPADPSLDPDVVAEADAEELLITRYAVDDAQFSGIEIKLNIPLVQQQNYDLSLGLMADFIEAELKQDGAYLPRIPPLKYGIDLHLDKGAFSSTLRWISYQEQDKIFANELPTNGFDMLDLELAYRINQPGSDYFLFLRGNNLLDEEARDHSSFVKDLAPRAGRSFVAGLRATF